MGNTLSPSRLCTKRQPTRLRRDTSESQLTDSPRSDRSDTESSPTRHAAVLKDIKIAASNSSAVKEDLDRSTSDKTDIDGSKLIAALAKVYSGVMDPAIPDLSSRCSSCFHGFRKPSIGIEEYLERLREHFSCSDSCFLLALIYIIRLLDFCPNFVVNAFSIHRLLAISLVVSVKFHEDQIYSNTFYAKVSGLRQEELNAGELEFLKLIKWDCGFSHDMSHLYNEVLLSAEKANLEGMANSAVPACDSIGSVDSVGLVRSANKF
mmetsp:Transcript_80833/g.127718  ORF Transcript_80833/g.127718 Transcript_80833/m.127718 type:complete len:264 (+) Transcript_80833:75-866(+)